MKIGVDLSILNAVAVGQGGIDVFSFLTKNLLRSYPFNVLPAAYRNTFASGNTFGIDGPNAYFISNGTQETNHLLERVVEKFGDVNQPNRTLFGAPGATVGLDFRTLIACQLSADIDNTAAFADSSWVGICLGSPEANVLPVSGTALSGYFHLRWNLHDPTKWKLVMQGLGGNELYTEVEFTVPMVDGHAGNGHLVALDYDPTVPRCDAWVDGQLRASLDNTAGRFVTSIGAAASTAAMTAGLVAYSGAMASASTIRASWCAMSVVSFATGELGSGLV